MYDRALFCIPLAEHYFQLSLLQQLKIKAKNISMKLFVKFWIE